MGCWSGFVDPSPDATTPPQVETWGYQWLFLWNRGCDTSDYLSRQGQPFIAPGFNLGWAPGFDLGTQG